MILARYGRAMMSYQEVVRYLEWRAQGLRADARKARLLVGAASDVFAKSLEDAAAVLEKDAAEAKGKGG